MKLTLKMNHVLINKIVNDLSEGQKKRPLTYKKEITGYWKHHLSQINVKECGVSNICVTGESGFYFPGTTYSGIDMLNGLYKRFGLIRKTKKESIKTGDIELSKIFNLSIPQNPYLERTFGYKVSGKWISVDFLRSIYHAYKIIKYSKDKLPDNLRVLEIGSGTGIQALVFKLLFKKSTYFLVDFPETLALAEVFLNSVLPKSKCLFFDDWNKDPSKLLSNNSYDFVFIPNYAISQVPNDYIHLGLNTVSMQEMNYKTIDMYFEELRKKLTEPSLFYQCNRASKIMDGVPIEVKKYPYNSKDIHLYQGQDEFQHKIFIVRKLFGRFPLLRMLRIIIPRKADYGCYLTKLSK